MAADLDTTWLDGLVGYRLRRASHAMATDFAAHAPPGHLRPVLITMLGLIEANPGISSASLGAVLGIKRANMVALVAQLADDDLIERSESATDRRIVELRVTSSGAEAAVASRALIAEHEARMTSGLNGREVRQLLGFLARISDHDDIDDD